MNNQGLPSYNEAMKMSAPIPSAPISDQVLTQQPIPYTYSPAQPQQPIYPAQIQMPQPIIQQPQVYQPLVQPQPQPTVIVINQQIHFGENPVSMHCYHCNQQILTKINYENNVINHVLAGVLCFMGLICGCCCIPYCIDSIKDVKHKCPKCNTFLGIYRRGRRN